MGHYDAEHIRRFFDAYGLREWERHEVRPHDRVSFWLHKHYLARFVAPGTHVLEAGAGPGRYTIELARLGARVTVGDISEGQLVLNREHVAEAGLEGAVIAREQLDIIDLSRFKDVSFGAVVAYGGPLSYVMERADEALAELLRVTKPGGYVLLSVMSKVGTTRVFLPGVLELAREHGPAFVQEVLETGTLRAEVNDGHAMKMYAWRELSALFDRHACVLELASASNYLSTGYLEMLEEGMKDEALWARFLAWELELCREPGALDGGTHILAVLRRL